MRGLDHDLPRPPRAVGGGAADAADELVDAVSRRVRRCVDEKTAAAVLTDEAIRDVTALLAATPPPDGTPQSAARLAAVAAVALTDWFRSTALVGEAWQTAMFRAVSLFAVLQPLDADLVPAHVAATLASIPPDQVAIIQINAGAALQAQFLGGSQLGLLEWSTALYTDALRRLSPDHPERLPLLVNLASAQRLRVDTTADRGAADLAVTYSRQAVALAPAQPTVLAALSAALQQRYLATGTTSDLAAAIDTAREAAHCSSTSDPDHPARLATLSQALELEFRRTGRLAVLDESVDAAESALTAAAPDHSERATFLTGIGTVLRLRFDRRGSLADLDRSIALTREAALMTGSGPSQRVARMVNLAGALAARHTRTGDVDNLAEAVDIGYRALQEATGSADIHRGAVVAVLASALRRRFDLLGEHGDLDEAVAVLRDAVAGEGGGRYRAELLGVLCTTLQTRFDHRGQRVDLDDAIDAGETAVAKVATRDGQRPLYLSNLSGAYQSRFKATGARDDLERAITAARRAVAETSPDHPDLAARSTNLAIALQLRHEHTGQLADLDETIATLRRTATTLPARHPEHQVVGSNLGTALAQRFLRTEHRANLDEAVAIARDVLDATKADNPQRPGRRANLASVLLLRAGKTDDPSDLDEAVREFRTVVAELAVDHPDAMAVRSSLVRALVQRARRPGGRDDADEAVELARVTSAAIPDGHPYRARCLIDLGDALRERSERVGSATDRTAAVDAYRAAAGTASAASTVRLDAAWRWASTAESADDDPLALAGWTAAVELLPRAAWRGVDVVTQESQLARWSTLARDAAACALQLDAPDQAVELLEQGRSVLWNQRLESRSDLATLAVSHPELAARLDRIRHAQDTGAAESSVGGTRDDRARLARKWDETVDLVRRQPGFGGFLARTPASALQQAVVDGVAVVVNVAARRCDALAVTTDGIRSIPLPDLTVSDATAHGARRLSAVASRTPLQAVLAGVLGWLWASVTGPVLDALGIVASAQRPIRVWWCPTGPLTLLPLHASGAHGDGVFERVVSSYTPSIGALGRARAGPPPPALQSSLFVGMPTTPGGGFADLTAVSVEQAAHHDGVAAHGPVAALVRGHATRAAVLDALSGADRVHFACHGSQDPGDPGQGALHLWDGPLTIRELAGRPAAGASLAYLSACQTALGGVRVPDESIHLAAALGLAGFRHVVATLWPITDRHAPAVARRFYAGLTHGGALDVDRSATALHTAVGWLRARYPDRPWIWAPYIHVGP